LNLDRNEGYMQIKASALTEFAITKNRIDKTSYVYWLNIYRNHIKHEYSSFNTDFDIIIYILYLHL